jgi:hypothetical protein
VRSIEPVMEKNRFFFGLLRFLKLSTRFDNRKSCFLAVNVVDQK